MEILALLFALSTVIVTIIFWVYKLGVRLLEKNRESALLVQEEIAAPVVQVAPIIVASGKKMHTSGEDEIAVVIAAAANMYIKTN
jgi:hypothetical protein